MDYPESTVNCLNVCKKRSCCLQPVPDAVVRCGFFVGRREVLLLSGGRGEAFPSGGPDDRTPCFQRDSGICPRSGRIQGFSLFLESVPMTSRTSVTSVPLSQQPLQELCHGKPGIDQGF